MVGALGDQMESLLAWLSIYLWSLYIRVIIWPVARLQCNGENNVGGIGAPLRSVYNLIFNIHDMSLGVVHDVIQPHQQVIFFIILV